MISAYLGGTVLGTDSLSNRIVSVQCPLMSRTHLTQILLRDFLMWAGSKAGLSASRRKRAQSRSPATAAAEGLREGRGRREGPAQAQEPSVAQPQAAPAALPALTSWRKGPAAVQPPSSHAEGPSHIMLEAGSASKMSVSASFLTESVPIDCPSLVKRQQMCFCCQGLSCWICCRASLDIPSAQQPGSSSFP